MSCTMSIAQLIQWELSSSSKKWVFVRSEHGVAQIVRSELSTPIYVECCKMYRSNLAFKNSGISCLALIFNLNNQTTILQAKKLFQVARNDEASTFFFRQSNMNIWLRNNGLVGKASRSESGRVTVSRATVSLAIWVRFSLGAETLCSPCIDKHAFILLLSLYFFLSWISSLVITLNNNLIIQVRCPLFS